MRCSKCGSYAINHHLHGRDGSDANLCDVCYWRKRAESAMINTAMRCAKIAEHRATEAERNMMIYPDGDYKVEVYEMAMIECEYVAKDIRKEFGF